ncbi:acyl-CoA dehydrogenase family protein [uncultured Piscinibacter sp.]|uniref:acyl-CoA dehydrogenase family protein n=1 Tax=uncultured Piscinibacter sp. TaxID=1131835 RepID=UPI00262626EE|nr:acyl-CoA dehydrogenase family protein [uncultured Piscinibacter sp.]
MWQYEAPLRDMRYVIEEVLSLPAHWAGMPAFAELDADTARQVLAEAARFATEVLAPTNGPGDLEGCTLADGDVRTPKGFKAAYRAFVEAGWPALACDPALGGQGLPQVLNAALYEMLAAANHAWTMYPGLLHGAYECLHLHASAELKQRYLAKLVSGEWLSTMCLTEAHAGSDLGLLSTKATPAADGSYALRGTKIFISGGDHDLTDNIVHLVLARLPDAPAGTKGISLFLAPKILPDGARNALRCDGLEKKMGIKGSATCVMAFDGATGWLVGEPNRGLAAMFAMMNAARLHVALQGLAHAQNAHRNALVYAHERLQSRAPVRDGGGAADPIVLHPAMRRTLLRQRVLVEGSRLIAYEAAHLLDLAEHAQDAALRERAQDHAALLTPVLKSFLTDNGFALASDALQVFGGHGYTHDWGIEQCVRDARIAMIYEGTNQIQAIDLVVRKLVADGGRRFCDWLEVLAAALPREARYSAAAAEQLMCLCKLARDVATASRGDAELPFRVADDLLRATGLALIAHAWARAEAVSARTVHDGDAFHATKRESAAHCFTHLRPEFDHALAQARAGWQPFARLDLPRTA